MGIKERKVRERESLRALIVASAHEILAKEGVDGLTMRSIAHQIEHSQSKIYAFFASKDELCEVLCADHCTNLSKLLHKISINDVPEKYFIKLIMKTMEYHQAYPHSDALFTLVCFGGQRFKIPEKFFEVENLFVIALKNLNTPCLVREEDIASALDIIRCLFIGVSNLMHSETSLAGKRRGMKIIENALEILLKGWKQ